MHRRVSAKYVVVGQDVAEAQFLDPLSIGTDRAAVGADLCLRKHDADVHI
jgi:hypothetical protein